MRVCRPGNLPRRGGPLVAIRGDVAPGILVLDFSDQPGDGVVQVVFGDDGLDPVAGPERVTPRASSRADNSPVGTAGESRCRAKRRRIPTTFLPFNKSLFTVLTPWQVVRQIRLTPRSPK